MDRTHQNQNYHFQVMFLILMLNLTISGGHLESTRSDMQTVDPRADFGLFEIFTGINFFLSSRAFYTGFSIFSKLFTGGQKYSTRNFSKKSDYRRH